VEFHFRVKFFVENPRAQLLEEYTRYLYVLQLQRDIVDGTLPCPMPVAAALAACAIQSELGDAPLVEPPGSPLASLRLIPNQNEELERAAMELHLTMRGMTPADAELRFLDEAKELEFYGVELHGAWDEERNQLQVGVCSEGLHVYKNGKKSRTFLWETINKLSFKRRSFFVELRREEVTFTLSCYRSCKNLWKSCVEHHTFFKLPREPAPETVREISVPKVLFHPSLRRFPFIPGGSKFRYTGKTALQAFEESRNRPKNDKSFVRSFSKYILRKNGARVPQQQPVTRVEQTEVTLRSPKILNGRPASAPLPQRRNSLHLPLDIPSKYVCSPKKFRSNPNSPSRRASLENGLVTIEMRADSQGRFGFNVKGEFILVFNSRSNVIPNPWVANLQSEQ
jgi:tyrosine-protein phosphatase non-receptor type 4